MTAWLPVVLAGAAAAAWADSSRQGQRRLAALRDREAAGAGDADGGPSLLDRGAPVLVAAGALVVSGPLVAALAVIAVVGWRRWAARRRHLALAAQERSRALEALSLLGGDLRSGRSPAEALAAAGQIATGPTSTGFLAAAAAARLGGDVSRSLVVNASAVPELLRGLAACWQVCSGTGSGLATAVERLEEGLRAGAAQRRAMAAELAGPRATAGLLAVLPLAGLALAAVLGAAPLHVLLHTPVGMVSLFVGALLDGLGVIWTRRLVGSALPE